MMSPLIYILITYKLKPWLEYQFYYGKYKYLYNNNMFGKYTIKCFDSLTPTYVLTVKPQCILCINSIIFLFVFINATDSRINYNFHANTFFE